jgi:acyl carrier protein
MTLPNIEENVCRALSLALDRPIRAGEEVRREQEPRWDSHNHVELLLSLEDMFEVTFSDDEIPRLTSLAAIVGMVAEKRRGLG